MKFLVWWKRKLSCADKLGQNEKLEQNKNNYKLCINNQLHDTNFHVVRQWIITYTSIQTESDFRPTRVSPRLQPANVLI